MLVINTKKIIEYTEKTIYGSKNRLVIVSPFLDINDYLLASLKYKNDYKTKIIFVCGKKALVKDEKEKLKQLKNIELRFLINLHAKFILNEEYGVISSMNLYEASEKNYELGVLISKKIDPDGFSSLENECYKIIKDSEIYRDDFVKKNSADI